MSTSLAWARCPFAARGIDSPEMAACPGYDPEVVPVGAERIVGSGHSCRHLRPQRDPTRGGFVSACTHPVLGTSGGIDGLTGGRRGAQASTQPHRSHSVDGGQYDSRDIMFGGREDPEEDVA